MNESNGYTKAPHDIVRDPNLSPASKVAWLLIAGMPDGYYPTREQWMSMIPCKDKSTWQRAIDELKEAGLVEAEKRGTKRVFKAVLKGEKTTLSFGGKNHPLKGEKTTHKRVKKPPEKGVKKPPYMKNIEEQEEYIHDDGAGAGARERFIQEINQDYIIEQACMSLGIDRQTYETLSRQVIAEWRFRDLADSEWTRMHLLSVMRYKVADLKKQNNNGQAQNGINRRPAAEGRAARAAGIAATMAALGAAGGEVEELPY